MTCCPECGKPGTPIAARTAIAVTSSPLPPRQPLFLCATPDCGLVYFGPEGARVPVTSLRLRPTWKGGDVLCFCFDHRQSELVAALVAGDGHDLSASIEARVKAGDCACELRNPTGRCCLPEVRRATAALAARLTAS